MDAEQAINEIQNMQPTVQDDDFDPFMTDLTGDDVISSINTVLQSGGFQDTDLVTRFNKEEITRDDFSKTIFEELGKQFEDNDIRTYRDTRTHLIIENQAEFIATQAALTGNSVLDFYIDGSTQQEVQLQQIPEEPEPQPQQEPQQYVPMYQRPPEPQPQPVVEQPQPVIEQPQPQPVVEQPQPQPEPQPEPVVEQPQQLFEEEIIQPQPQPQPEPQQFFEQPEPQPQQFFEEEIIQPQPEPQQVQDIPRAEANVFFEEEIIAPQQPQVSEPIVEEDFTPYAGDMQPVPQPTPAMPQPQVAQAPQPAQSASGLMEGMTDDLGFSDFEIDNEVDSDVYDLSELKVNRVDTGRI